MKKILLSACACIALFGTSIAQQKQSILTNPLKLDNAKISGSVNLRMPKASGKKTRGGTVTLNNVGFVAAEEGISQTQLDNSSSLYYMFPDSVVRYGAPNSGYGIQWKSIGQTLDPWADVYRNNLLSGEIMIEKTTPYTVDSVFLIGSYIKKTAAVDTLIVSIVHSGGTNMPEYYYTGQTTDFGVDTTRFLAQTYNPANFTTGPFSTNLVGAPAAYTIRYPLTNNDSSTFTAPNSYGIKELAFPVNYAVPAGERVNVSFTFKPGYSYAAGDTIGKNNHYLFLSFEPNGDNTFMPYYPTDRNMSSVISKDSSGYEGLYIPTLAWTQPYGSEMHGITWTLTCPTCNPVGVGSVNDNGINVTAKPNPANDRVKLGINLTESAKNVSVQFTNSIGQVIKTMNLGNIEANSNKEFTVPVTDMAKGLYIYTINADGKKYSSKLMVN